jgi:hypothetical protein
VRFHFFNFIYHLFAMKNQLLKNVSGVLHTEGLLLRLCFVLCCLLSVSVTSAQQRISIQGTLKKANGSPLDDGYYRVTFKLYGALTGGNALWQETTDSVEVSGGIYSHALGSKTSLTTSTFTSTVYLGVQVGTYEMTPRTEITYAPYAFAVYSAVCSGAVGDVKFSVLNPAQFKKANGDCWVPLDGRSISGTALATYGISTPQNAGGYFLRAQEFGSSYTYGGTTVTTTESGNIDDDRTSSSTIAMAQAAELRSHSHGDWTGDAGGHSHGSNAPGGQGKNGLASTDKDGKNTIGQVTDITFNQIDIVAAPQALEIYGVGDHRHSIPFDGGKETRPDNLNFYIYIRVN